MTIEFTVPAVPVAQPRQRHRIISSGGRTFAQNYTPAKSPVADFKATVRMLAAQAYQGPPLEGPIRVDVCFVFPRPKSRPPWIAKGSYWETEWKGGYRVPKITKPDRDNLDKGFLDALEGLLWVDDSQVCAGEPTKFHATKDEQPHVVVRIETL